MRRRDFELAVDQALRELPPTVKEALRQVSVEVADQPTREIVRDSGIKRSDSLFGWYEGTPLTERTGDFGMTVPDRIIIFRRPLEAAFRQRRDLIDQIKTTVRHEVGHHLGLSEDELTNLGLE